MLLLTSLLCLQICQFLWDSQHRLAAPVYDRLCGSAIICQTVAPSQIKSQHVYDHSYIAASLE